jgi:hypothetical protein
VTPLTQKVDCAKLSAVHFGWFVETWGFHFNKILGFPVDLVAVEAQVWTKTWRSHILWMLSRVTTT